MWIILISEPVYNKNGPGLPAPISQFIVSKNSFRRAESTWEDALELVTVSIIPITNLFIVPLKGTASGDPDFGPRVIAAYEDAEKQLTAIYSKVEAHLTAHTLTTDLAQAYFQEVDNILLGEPQEALEELNNANPNVGVLCLAYAGAGISSIQVYAKRIMEIVAEQELNK